jgi:hypothetical protein
MMVDGAAADTESLEDQAAKTASQTLGASLGSDSPYLVPPKSPPLHPSAMQCDIASVLLGISAA